VTEIIIIAAVAENGVIGSKDDIPWRISEDFKRFKRLTLGHPCIMGDATYASLPEVSRPLPGRENVVLSIDRSYRAEGATVFHDFDEAIGYVRQQGNSKAFITGGATIYALALSIADTLELTRIHREYEGDVRFPAFDGLGFELVSAETHQAIDRVSSELVRFTYETHRRR
jgi:dihydrofolate reductase